MQTLCLPFFDSFPPGSCAAVRRVLFQTYFCVTVSNTPRVVRRSVGMTGSAMNESVMNGSTPRLTPRANAFSLAFSSSRLTSTSGSSLMMPAIWSRTSPSTSPWSSTTMPPPSSTTRLAAAAMSSSFVPTTMMLWLSCEMEVATAPDLRP